MEEYLHKALIDAVAPDMTFEELYYYMNDVIVKKGFINLDFLGNPGHSIEKTKMIEYILKRETIKDYQMLKCLPLNLISVLLIPNMDIREKISIILITAG